MLFVPKYDIIGYMPDPRLLPQSERRHIVLTESRATTLGFYSYFTDQVIASFADDADSLGNTGLSESLRLMQEATSLQGIPDADLDLHIGMKKENTEDAGRTAKGEDVGINACIITPDEREININVFGGRRTSTTEDWSSQGYGAFSRGGGHTTMTDAVASLPRDVNINVRKSGALVADIWVKTHPGRKTVTLTLLNVTDRGILRTLPLDMPKPQLDEETVQYMMDGLLAQVERLFQARDNVLALDK